MSTPRRFNYDFWRGVVCCYLVINALDIFANILGQIDAVFLQQSKPAGLPDHFFFSLILLFLNFVLMFGPALLLVLKLRRAVLIAILAMIVYLFWTILPMTLVMEHLSVRLAHRYLIDNFFRIAEAAGILAILFAIRRPLVVVADE